MKSQASAWFNGIMCHEVRYDIEQHRNGLYHIDLERNLSIVYKVEMIEQ